jgi:hypothetical protein
MAPEILFNARGGYTANADLWSVGCIMFELLHGRAPYGSAPRSTEADLRRDITEDKRYARDPPAALSEACRELLAGLLRRDPSERISYEGLFDHGWLGGGSGALPAAAAAAAARGRGALISGKYVMSKALLGEGSFATVGRNNIIEFYLNLSPRLFALASGGHAKCFCDVLVLFRVIPLGALRASAVRPSCAPRSWTDPRPLFRFSRASTSRPGRR